MDRGSARFRGLFERSASWRPVKWFNATKGFGFIQPLPGVLLRNHKHAEWLVELRGFEPLTSLVRAPTLLGRTASDPAGATEGAPLNPALDRYCFTCPTRGYRLERLAGLGENRRVACRGFIAAYDHIDVQRIEFDASAHTLGALSHLAFLLLITYLTAGLGFNRFNGLESR